MQQRRRPSVDISTLCALLSRAEDSSCSGIIMAAACFRGAVNSALLIIKWRAHHFPNFYRLTFKQIGVMFLKRPVLHFCCCLISPPAIQQSLCEKWRSHALSVAWARTVINVDEWAGRPSLFQPSLNRKFPLSLTMYSLYQSDRVEASYTPLPSPSP